MQGSFGDYPGPHCIVEGGASKLVNAVATEEVSDGVGGWRVVVFSASGFFFVVLFTPFFYPVVFVTSFSVGVPILYTSGRCIL